MGHHVSIGKNVLWFQITLRYLTAALLPGLLQKSLMATTTSVQEEASKALKCQTWVLKVSIHCQGCKRKVKKVLQSIDGVYTTSIDSQQQRVTVTGNIEAGTLIKKLMKTGKHAEIWPEKLATKEKESSGKAKNMHKTNGPKSVQNHSGNGSKRSVMFSVEGLGEEINNGDKLPDNSTAGPGGNNKGSITEGGGSGGGVNSGGKKKKKKGQKGNDGSNVMGGSGLSPSSGTSAGSGDQTNGVEMDQVVGPSNLNPTRQHSIPWRQGYSIPQVYASSYSMAYPCGSPAPFYHVPPSPYTNANANQTTQLESFNIFSDENVNGCSIM
ncbi:unnamed protein product [Dovyalis caffra]|uniref:HMA domain-containing protein n=1 Tax=Dovyalis caffra TaxID=77055 RepID=A0AAV1RC49_9ROSI|nr:unnamed protein product [Dovyalis caffra]